MPGPSGLLQRIWRIKRKEGSLNRGPRQLDFSGVLTGSDWKGSPAGLFRRQGDRTWTRITHFELV